MPLDVGYLPQLLQGLPSLVLGAEDTMVFTPNFRNVGSLAGETAACDEPPRSEEHTSELQSLQ